MPFDGLQNLISKLDAFDFGAELETIVEENKDKIPDLIRKQLEAGKDGNDVPNTIFGRSGYSPKTVEIKRANGVGLGAITDRITNYMTGAFQESLEVKVSGQVFEADSDVSYFGDITLYSSPELLFVDEENRREFANEVTIPGIRAALLSKTGLTIT